MKKLFMALVLTGTATLLALVLWVNGQVHQPLQVDEPQLLEVAPGQNLISLLQQFESQNWIDSSLPFRLWLRATSESGRIHAGEYQLEPGLTLHDLYTRMRDGEVVTYQVTLVEGWTFAEIRAALAAASKLEPVSHDWSEEKIMATLGQPEEPAEGWFFPDTYVYHQGMKDLDILRQAHERMQLLLEEVWSERQPDLPLDSPYEALILASIVERETGAAHERRDIAGVFIRRLEKGMRLQTDPTVIYGMGEDYQGRITYADLRRPTPWNTYTIRGLPPTPIASPGEAALRASVNPAEGEALYFVARGDGTHQFSATLEEHNQAVREYQHRRREDYRSWPAAEAADEESTGTEDTQP
ncbi:endolytic transglycosylase MltG [Marinospirillum perlucidum]|uniref:endolytic transglycosylase MltG n=1 Tax=Marinospirillum perlucidum TaxID=1982602 RepID=UPI000DF2BDBC|nr:endolytic transglycosylase MltG [Marinospirillum perlucidum]